MPKGWKTNSSLPAAGFFTVGKHVPNGWMNVQIGKPDPFKALWEGQLERTILSPAGKSPLWGMGDTGQIRTDWKALRQAGICINPNTLLASPYWDRGIHRRRALVRCDGTAARPDATHALWLGLYDDETGWQESGALAEQILQRLSDVQARERYDLVCITPEIAEWRRQLRSEQEKPDV